MPTNHRIEWKLKGTTNGMRLAIGDTTHTNASGYLEWIYAIYTDGTKKLYYRSSSNSEQNKTITFSQDTNTVYAVEYEGTTIKIYVGDTLNTTQSNAYDPLSLTRLLRLNSDRINNFDWIKVKPL